MRRTRTTTCTASAALLTLAVALTACGGGDAEEAPSVASFTGGEATFVGTGAIAWEPSTIDADLADGELEATIVCEGSTPHDLVIQGVADEEGLVECEGNDRATTVVPLEPGTYEFWCSIPGHRGAGMEGVLTVE